MTGRRGLVLSFIGLFAAAALPAAAGAQGRVEPVAGLVDEAESIVAGPDGAMWASIAANPGRVVRITTEGAVSYQGVGGIAGFPINRRPGGLTSHGGALWFALSGGPETLARLRVGEPLARFSLTYGRPTSLTDGPDGALWMTVEGRGGRPDAITRFVADPPGETPHALGGNSHPRSIVLGPDSALWFVEAARDQIGRITASGALSYRSVGAAPTSLAADPSSGSLWYAQGSSVRRLDDAAAYSTGSPVSGLAPGPDGAVWAAVRGGAARIVPGETPTTVTDGINPAARGRAIAAGPDGRMWMTLDRPPYLVKITVPPFVDGASLAEADGWLTATINPNGLGAWAWAERQKADGSWEVVAGTEVSAATSATTVRLRLAGLTPGDNFVRMTVETAAGTSSTRPITVRRPIAPEPKANPIPAATPTPAATPPTPTPASGAVEGKSVEVAVLSGTVSYRDPADTAYTELKGSATLPLGVLLDTTDGKVRVSSQVDGATQAATFHGGKFSVTQTPSGMTEMALAGALDCSASERAGISAKPKKKKKKKRLLWGKDSGGSFRTRGNGSVATVRGTEWRTEDTCAGTTVYVREGAVSVWPRRGGRSKLVRAGRRLFAPRPG